MSILTYDASAQAALIKAGEITPLELVDAAISAAEELNPTLNAVITPMFEAAREQAKSDLPDAPFKGVPIVLKDGIATYKGVRMTSGSALYKNYIGRFDSTLVKRLKKAGFIVIGKTNLPEFGLLPVTEPLAYGACRNPYDTNLTPGGSSGGTASAVAARIVALGHGNDGGGSIRIPASCCGLFGLKPTRGRNPLGPNFSELVGGLVAEHVLTRSVRDSAAVLDLTAGAELDSIYYAPPKNGSYLEALKEKPRKLRIGFSTTSPNGNPLHQDCIAATMATVKLCEDLGHEVIPKQLKMPFGGKQLGEIFATTWAVGATGAVAMTKKMTGKLPPKESLEPLTWALYEISQNIKASDYEMARMGMWAVARSVMRSFHDIDVWLSPTLGMPPVEIGAMAQNFEDPMAPMRLAGKFSPMTAIFNISGQPAASVPTYWNENGIPIGVQMVGKFGDEKTLFQLAGQMEEVVKWGERKPTVCAV